MFSLQVPWGILHRYPRRILENPGREIDYGKLRPNSTTMETGCKRFDNKKEKLLFCLVDLHPHLFVQRGNFVGFAGVLGDLVIQILYIGCSCLELAVHTDILALERYHGVSPAVYMIGRIFILILNFSKTVLNGEGYRDGKSIR